MIELDERLLKMIKRKMGYSNKELETFIEDPKNLELITKAKEYSQKEIVLTVVESKGCNSNHKTGDKFYFDFAGNILTEKCPSKICSYSLNSALMMIFSANEMIYAGIDPEQMKFKRSSCFDVGIECGGWGRIVLELSVEEK